MLAHYRELRPLLIGAWYPLTPYTIDQAKWLAEQFHRPDLNQGMVLAFRHEKSTDATMKLQLHGLDAATQYELHFDSANKTERHTGRELMEGLDVSLPNHPDSELITYTAVKPN